MGQRWRLQVRRYWSHDGGRYSEVASGHGIHGINPRWRTSLSSAPHVLADDRLGSCKSDCSFARLVGCVLYEQLQGKLLLSYEISQACPGISGQRYGCFTAARNYAVWDFAPLMKEKKLTPDFGFENRSEQHTRYASPLFKHGGPNLSPLAANDLTPRAARIPPQVYPPRS